jgi:hypothetical protein
LEDEEKQFDSKYLESKIQKSAPAIKHNATLVLNLFDGINNYNAICTCNLLTPGALLVIDKSTEIRKNYLLLEDYEIVYQSL